MKLVTPTSYLGTKFGEEKAIELIATSGFDGIDYSASHMLLDDSPLNAPDWREYAKMIKSKAESENVEICQAHAPFPSSSGEPTFDAEIKEKIIRCIEAVSIMGAEVIVIHPIQHLPYIFNAQELFEMNMKFYNELIPFGEKFKIKIAVENMFQWDSRCDCPIESTCAAPDEFAKYIDTLNSHWITACLDLGHCSLCHREAQDYIRYMGADRVTCLHVHDNDYKTDKHTLPFTMDMNWVEICKALAQIGYTGNLTYEADDFLKRYPDEFLMTALKFMYDTGRLLIKMINEYK